ncbi:MAG: DUF4440 domain-containing protein [Gammaproteobacteria bacterium]|jgi:ketosteroid isomerase-like protein|nr:DUF4440 domain-containing protein [Gammaproteobacteria bacterium]
MPVTTRPFGVLLAFQLLLASGAALADDDRVVLARLLATFLAGASENDAAVHERFWADDLVYTSSDGRRYGKPEILSSMADAGDESRLPPTVYSARDTSIRVFGDTAVITFRLLADQAGERVGEYYNTGVFRRRAEGWQAVTWQATRAASMASASDSGDQG